MNEERLRACFMLERERKKNKGRLECGRALSLRERERERMRNQGIVNFSKGILKGEVSLYC